MFGFLAGSWTLFLLIRYDVWRFSVVFCYWKMFLLLFQSMWLMFFVADWYNFTVLSRNYRFTMMCRCEQRWSMTRPMRHNIMLLWRLNTSTSTNKTCSWLTQTTNLQLSTTIYRATCVLPSPDCMSSSRRKNSLRTSFMTVTVRYAAWKWSCRD